MCPAPACSAYKAVRAALALHARLAAPTSHVRCTLALFMYAAIGGPAQSETAALGADIGALFWWLQQVTCHASRGLHASALPWASHCTVCGHGLFSSHQTSLEERQRAQDTSHTAPNVIDRVYVVTEHLTINKRARLPMHPCPGMQPLTSRMPAAPPGTGEGAAARARSEMRALYIPLHLHSCHTCSS